MEKSLKLRIGGMTCARCQARVERELARADGVVRASVSYRAATADVVYDSDRATPAGIAAIIDRLGYRAVAAAPAARGLAAIIQPSPWRVAGALGAIAALYAALHCTGALNLLAPSRLADAGAGYGMLLLIGLLTSVHCVAMCGGINVSQCLPRAPIAPDAPSAARAAFLPAVAYNLGRVASYSATGLALGTAGYLLGGGGGEAGLPAFLQGALKIVAGLCMVAMGLNALGLFPALRRFALPLPRFLARAAERRRAGARRPFCVGFLNGFMPCGPLQSMWLVALAAAHPLAGALSMLAFSLGTVPLMLGLGSLVSALGRRFTDQAMLAGGVLVAAMGLAMLSQGGALSGLFSPAPLLALTVALAIAASILSVPAARPAARRARLAAALAVVVGGVAWLAMAEGRAGGAGAAASPQGDAQVVNSVLAPGRYPSITVRAGVPVRWVIEAAEDDINGCNDRIVIPAYGLEHAFHPGENVIEFTPSQTGTVRYSCWMGMIHGDIHVVDGPAAPAAPAG